MNKLKKYLLILAIFALGQLSQIPASYARSVLITSPIDGTVVHPGQIITISVSTDPINEPVLVLPQSPLPATTKGELPNTFFLAIPNDISIGTYHITAMGTDPFNISRVSIKIEPSDSPISIQFDWTSIRFEENDMPLPLHVTGLFPSGRSVDLTHSPGIKYSVANTAVASVTPEGLVTAVGPGGTTVTASYAGLSSSIPVVVPLGNATPVYKITAAPIGAISKDDGGYFYIVKVNIKNNSNTTLGLLKLTSATLNLQNAAQLPDAFTTVFDPNASEAIILAFPLTAGVSGSTVPLQLKGTYEGLPKNGQSGDKGALNFSFRVKLP